MKYLSAKRLITSVVLLACLTVLAPAQKKEQQDKIDRMAVQLEELKTEFILLQRQMQAMQETFNKTNGEARTLIEQMGDNIAAIRRAQSSVATNATETALQISQMGERVSATNQRMERLSEQFAQLKKLIEDVPKQPVLAQMTPGNAEQLFGAAVSDYYRGNYDLALSEFRQYVDTFPTSELADNAQYWVGEILYAQKKLPEAANEWEKVATISPQGDKTRVALYKRALVLLDLGKKEEAVAQLLAITKTFPNTSEATLATQQLQQIAPEALAPPPPAPTPTPTRKRKPR
jgi:tol-pal system protein YbgF